MRTETLTAPAAGLTAPAPARPPSVGGIARSVLRSAGFGLSLACAAIDYLREASFSRRGDPLPRRARWLHRWCRVFAWCIGLRVESRGVFPRPGMIVSNHLSYLDIVAFSALAPCVFVAKKEVAGWPVFGWFARMAGTIFVDRSRRMEVGESNVAIRSALRGGAVVVLFAEGTSSGGQGVLPFRSSLLDPVLHAGVEIAPTAITYDMEEGSVPEEVCYWGEMTLLPHLFNFLGKQEVHARIAFGGIEKERLPRSRKESAVILREAVAALHRDLQACATRS